MQHPRPWQSPAGAWQPPPVYQQQQSHQPHGLPPFAVLAPAGGAHRPPGPAAPPAGPLPDQLAAVILPQMPPEQLQLFYALSKPSQIGYLRHCFDSGHLAPLGGSTAAAAGTGESQAAAAVPAGASSAAAADSQQGTAAPAANGAQPTAAAVAAAAPADQQQQPAVKRLKLDSLLRFKEAAAPGDPYDALLQRFKQGGASSMEAAAGEAPWGGAIAGSGQQQQQQPPPTAAELWPELKSFLSSEGVRRAAFQSDTEFDERHAAAFLVAYAQQPPTVQAAWGQLLRLLIQQQEHTAAVAMMLKIGRPLAG